MNWLWSAACFVAVPAAAATLYALHRLCLRLEDAGYMYYLHKKPGGGGGGLGSLVELQRALEPTTRYVVELKEERVRNVRDDKAESDTPRLFPPCAGDDRSEHGPD